MLNIGNKQVSSMSVAGSLRELSQMTLGNDNAMMCEPTVKKIMSKPNKVSCDFNTNID